MTESKKLYIAGIGMITSVGANTAMTTASVNAGISAYNVTKYENKNGQPLTMALISSDVFHFIEEETGLALDQGRRYNSRHDRMTIMAAIALQEACTNLKTENAVPLIMAQPEYRFDQTNLSSLIENLTTVVSPWVNSELCRSLYSGRAGGIEAINIIFDYLYDSHHDYFLVGASDSYLDDGRLKELDQAERLLHLNANNGFAPGEGAGYLVLTRNPALALVKEGNIVALFPPGIAEEQGHLTSEQPYRGDGLDQAFKKALIAHQQNDISTIYSSLNGEHHWAKELGVAQMRNKKAFSPQVSINHPAESFGDLGAATASVLIGLAAQNLWSSQQEHKQLVYSSSDSAKRGAIVLAKQVANINGNADQINKDISCQN